MKRIMFLASLLLVITSCGVNSNVMFKVPKGEINYDSIPMTPVEDYRISVDDKITFSLTTNKGANLINQISGVSDENRGGGAVTEYVVRRTGEVELPLIGMIKIEGLTIAQCEDTLTQLYSSYQDPFVQVKVTNQRVIVFPGNGSDARVIPLLNANTTLMEAIAQAGGITDRGKSNTVKLMRKIGDKREVYGIDLSTIDGLKYVDMIVQANDYIYVEPKPELAREIATDIVPVVSLISSALFIFTAINLFK